MRDMREAESLGTKLLAVADRERAASAVIDGDRPTLSQVYDRSHGQMLDVPDYRGGFEDIPALRKRELEERAAEGDRFAAAVLEGGSLAEDVVD
jgi:hypothetical protein